jgi:hypothetical protein
MIQAYRQILAVSPWSRADQTMRDRLGLTHGSIALVEDDAKMPKKERLTALAQQFENQLASIEGDKDVDLDALDLLDFDEDESVEWLDEVPESGTEEAVSPLSLYDSKELLKNLWVEAGIADAPKRPVTKRIEWSIVDWQVITKVTWHREAAPIRRSHRGKL